MKHGTPVLLSTVDFLSGLRRFILKIFRVPTFIKAMYVCVKGDPQASSCSIVGLDILGTRHPKLFTHILERMGFSLNCSNVGRQFVLSPALYPTDALNILVETGGFRIITSAGQPATNIVVWTLEK